MRVAWQHSHFGNILGKIVSVLELTPSISAVLKEIFLTLKAPITTAEDDILNYFFFF